MRARDSEEKVFFQVEVNVSPLGVELLYEKTGVVYAKEVQARFRTLQSLVLSELSKERGLFKNPPTLSALEAITPNWGFVQQAYGIMSMTPHTKFEKPTFPESHIPCLVDIQLKSLEISRSTIRPVWKLHYLGRPPSEIDFEWEVPKPAGDELEEVSDVPSAEGPAVTLADPARLAKEKAEAKERIRTAFEAAKTARTKAKQMAAEFYDRYDLSDSESAFTEWLSDSDEEDDS